MADAKISQLPVATTPLAGTELVPVVQTATTKQTTVDAVIAAAAASGTVVASSDVGTAPNQIPLNQYLGTLAYQDATSVIVNDLSATGNVVLGDASTDSVRVNGYMGVGAAGNASYSVNISSTALTGTSQRAISASPVYTSAATANGITLASIPSTAAAAFTMSALYGVRAFDATKGAGSTITNLHGIQVDDQTQGTNNYGITSLVSSGTNKWNIYASGTANNAFAGNVRIGSTTAPTNALDVTGAMTVSGNVTLGDASTDTVRVNGYMGIGSTNDANLFRITGSGAFAGLIQVGLSAVPTGTTIGTTALVGVASSLTTATAAYTVTNAYVFQAANATKGAGSTITNLHGLYIDDQTQGANNFGITSVVSSGANKWNIYASGTAANYFAGNVGIGTSSPATQLHLSGSSPIIRLSDTDGSGEYCQISGNSSSGSLSLQADEGNTAGSSIIAFRVDASEKMRIDSSGNVKIGGTADRATTVGTKHLDIFDGTAPVGTLANGISIYSSSGEAYVMDAAGNATLFSPHDAETNEWIFKSKHTPTGKVLKIDVERLLRFVNDHFGLDAVQEFIEE